ncbi:MAG: hypothetical protein WAT71_16285 [Ignavibacteria bacterium]
MNINQNKLTDKLEITFNIEEAEEFLFRLNDLANNPSYRENTERDDVIFGDEIITKHGLSKMTSEIFMFVYTKKNFENLSKSAIEIIKNDNLI